MSKIGENILKVTNTPKEFTKLAHPSRMTGASAKEVGVAVVTVIAADWVANIVYDNVLEPACRPAFNWVKKKVTKLVKG